MFDVSSNLRRSIGRALIGTAMVAAMAVASGGTLAQTEEDEARWAELAEIYFPDRTIVDRPDLLTMASHTMQYLSEIAKSNGAPVKTISYIHDNTSFGTSLFKHVDRLAPKYGWEIAADVPYSPRATDVSTEVNKIKFAGADVVFHSGYFNDSIRVLRTMQDLRIKAMGIVGMANGAYSQAKFVSEMGSKAEHVMDGNYRANPKSAMTARVFAAYKRQFKEVMPSHAVYSYQAVKVIAAALEKSGSRDREALREALTKTRVNKHILPQGTIMFGSDGQNVNARAAMMQILDQKVQVVWPNPYAQAKPVFPH